MQTEKRIYTADKPFRDIELKQQLREMITELRDCLVLGTASKYRMRQNALAIIRKWEETFTLNEEGR